MRLSSLLFLILALLVIAPLLPVDVHADTISEIKSRIDSHNDEIQKLEEEIAGYQRQLNALAGEKQTLQGAIQTLDVSRSQTSAQIAALQAKIKAATLKLDELSFEITDKEEVIALDRRTLAEALRTIAKTDDDSLVELILSSKSITDVWTSVDNLNTVGEALRVHADALTQAKAVLKSQHQEVNETKSKLSYLNTDLVSQKKALDANRASKQTLLNETQSQEVAYQQLIEQKRAQQKAFEAELRALESELQIAIDPSRIPTAGSGVLRWPFLLSFMDGCKTRESALKNPYCITQYFGNTSFSTANPQIYNGNGHPGVDFGAPSGTPIAAALSGTVLDTGNTDSAPGCYSFGKWVVIKHPNGLATLYAHLSTIGVTAGQSVVTGDVIGNSGMTGYATGPHLHFGVYASEGIRIMTLAEFRGATTPCAHAKIPVAPHEAYLNPMSYF